MCFFGFFLWRCWMLFWLVVSTHLKNISQIGSFPQIEVKIKHIWNHRLVFNWDFGGPIFFGPRPRPLHRTPQISINKPRSGDQFLDVLPKDDAINDAAIFTAAWKRGPKKKNTQRPDGSNKNVSKNAWKVRIQTIWNTLPETNIAPEKRPSQKESNIPTIHFQVLC